MWRNLRKFGLEYCDLPTTLWNITVLLRLFTLNIDSRYTKRIPLSFYVITLVTTICYFYTYFISVVWFVFVRCRETGDLIAALIVSSLGTSSEIGFSKLIFMFVYSEKLKVIVDGYRQCDSLVIHGSRFHKNLMKQMRWVKKRAILFWSVIISNGVIYITTPLVLPGRHLMEDSFILYGLEPMIETPYYESSLIIEGLACCFTCYTAANISTFLIILVGYIESQLLALSEELLHVWEDANEQKITDENNSISSNSQKFEQINGRSLNQNVDNYLKEVIKKHTVIINLIRQVESVFCDAIAVEFILLIMGLVAELLGGLENTYILMPFALMTVGMDCFTGQRLKDASNVYDTALYECKWENFDRKNMKTVLIMLVNAQKTLTLSAGGVATLDFVCFMTIIKSIYSTYTTLRSTMN